MIVKCAEEAVRYQLLGLRMVCRLAHACDKGLSQRKVLLDRSRREGSCVFCDVFDRVPDLAPFGTRKEVAYSIMKEVAQHARVHQFGYCVAHSSAGDPGQCPVQATDFDISGSPCNSWSAEGLRKRHNSPWIAATLAWCAWLVATSIPLAIHENVVNFDIKLLQETIGHLYDLYPLQVRPSQIGFGWIRRSRLYVVCVLRSALVVSHDIKELYSQVCDDAIRDRCNGTITDLVRASKEELLVEENMRRQSKQLKPLQQASNNWTYLLTRREKQVLQKLSQEWFERHHQKAIRDAECVFDLHRSLLAA